MENEYQRKPDICPQTAKSVHPVTTADTTKKAGYNNKWEYQQHDPYKKNHGV
jgi:hypothetical protein